MQRRVPGSGDEEVELWRVSQAGSAGVVGGEDILCRGLEVDPVFLGHGVSLHA